MTEANLLPWGGHADCAGAAAIVAPANKHEAKFWLHIADEIAEVVAHGGRGTLAGLWGHLNARFGRVTEHDLAGGLAMTPAHIREAFTDER